MLKSLLNLVISLSQMILVLHKKVKGQRGVSKLGIFHQNKSTIRLRAWEILSRDTWCGWRLHQLSSLEIDHRWKLIVFLYIHSLLKTWQQSGSLFNFFFLNQPLFGYLLESLCSALGSSINDRTPCNNNNNQTSVSSFSSVYQSIRAGIHVGEIEEE